MKIKVSETEYISQAEHVAAILSGTAKTTMTAATRAVAYRAPIHILAVVDAMAAHSGKSRNSMLNSLLQVGIDEVRENLDQIDIIQKLSVLESEHLQALSLQSFESVTE